MKPTQEGFYWAQFTPEATERMMLYIDVSVVWFNLGAKPYNPLDTVEIIGLDSHFSPDDFVWLSERLVAPITEKA